MIRILLSWCFRPGSDMAMENKGFIFTMDAILAIIPVFIILASVSSVSYSDSLFGQVFMPGGERVANDVLKTLDLKEELTDLNCTGLNNSLTDYIPKDYYFDFEIEYNSTPSGTLSVLCNSSSGSISAAKDIAAAGRITDASFFEILAEFIGISHLARDKTEPCCQNPGALGPGVGQSEYNGSFFIAAGEKSLFTFWVLGSQNPLATCKNLDIPSWIGMDPYHNTTSVKPYSRCEPQCQGGKGGMVALDDFVDGEFVMQFGVDLVDMITEDATNTVYIWVEGNPKCVGDFFIIRAPIDVDESDITLENVLLRTWVLAKLKVWPR
jgi:hypothetical protein